MEKLISLQSVTSFRLIFARNNAFSFFRPLKVRTMDSKWRLPECNAFDLGGIHKKAKSYYSGKDEDVFEKMMSVYRPSDSIQCR